MALSCKPFTTTGALVAALTALAALAPACAPEGSGPGEGGRAAGVPAKFQSFEEFRASVYREPWEGGAYIVEGDLPIFGDDELRAYYEGLRFGAGALVLGTRDGGDVIWGENERLNLSYCIDRTFTSDERDTIANDLATAAARWQAVADVHFVYKDDQDDSCDRGNNNVTFNVTKVQTNERYFARAFFPSDGRDRRQLNVDQLAFEPFRASSVDDVMTHELGHILGFRHEHGRAEATRQNPEACSENIEGWHAFTPYDARSVMAYPECGGFDQGQFKISPSDELGAAAIYGAPGRAQPPGPTPVAYRYELVGLSDKDFSPLNNAFTARGGTNFVAVLRGASGNVQPNLFVNRGSEAQPGLAECEPQIENDSPETCRIRLPDGPDVEIRVSYQAANGSVDAPAALSLTVVYVPGLSGG